MEHVLRTIHAPFLFGRYRPYENEGRYSYFRCNGDDKSKEDKNTVYMSEKQKVKEITDKLEAGLKELFESEKYKSYLSTMSKFHNYSFNNTLLIAMQKPEATLVAGYQAWQKNFERHVNKGEKAIRILAPAPYKIKEERDKLDPVTGEMNITVR